ncbi:MAG: glutamine-hydrolyzing GMP synthase [Acidobacteria bacterium]|nr:glutamine-hydrolyzing GMP synthase [Acidobacteriota bacterium]
MADEHETIIILDFGSQYTQLIARRIREAGVYSEIHAYNTPVEVFKNKNVKGYVLSGGPDSVFEKNAPKGDPRLLSCNVPILGICYGLQWMAQEQGGKVAAAEEHEYGRAHLQRRVKSPLFRGLPDEFSVWMSHGDHVEVPPADYAVIGMTGKTISAIQHRQRPFYGIQFHPEVAHTEHGTQILKNFLFEVCGCCGDWTMGSFADRTVAQIRDRVGAGQAVCALSGGVDSTVAAVLVDRAIGKRLTCIFVDNGLLRKDEYQEVIQRFQDKLHLNVLGIDARADFLSKLEGVCDPEEKRKIIGAEFIRIFERQAKSLGPVEYLVQGTLYPDVIESVSVRGPSAVIKTHHNVGGLPESMHLKLIEPLRELFKDEVRRVAQELGLDPEFIHRQPFPGPGLAVRILGPVSEERLSILRQADKIVEDEIRTAGLYEKIWQSFAILLPVSSVGVMGDGRTYENVVAVRAVHSQDGMTADWVHLPYPLLARISNRIVNEVRGVNRVVYDISSKPPSTIEWE